MPEMEIGTSGLNPMECSGPPHILAPWVRPARKRWAFLKNIAFGRPPSPPKTVASSEPV
jgi:hypothetical protein